MFQVVRCQAESNHLILIVSILPMFLRVDNDHSIQMLLIDIIFAQLLVLVNRIVA